MPLISSSNAGFNTYDPATHISELEVELASILFICGLDGSNPYAYEIDQIIDAIRETFKVTRTGPPIGSVPTSDEPILGDHMVFNGNGLTVPDAFISYVLSVLDTSGAGMPVEAMTKKWSSAVHMTCRRSHRWLRIASYARDNND